MHPVFKSLTPSSLSSFLPRVKLTRNVRVTKRLLSVKDVVAPPHMFDNTEWKGGWKRGHDPADGTLLCGQAGSRVHTEAAKGQAGKEAGSQYIYPTPEQNAVRSDGGDALIHLVSLGPLACYHLWISLFTASAQGTRQNGDWRHLVLWSLKLQKDCDQDQIVHLFVLLSEL